MAVATHKVAITLNMCSPFTEWIEIDNNWLCLIYLGVLKIWNIYKLCSAQSLS